MAAATACEKLTPAVVRTLEQHLGKMQQAIPRRDLTTFLRHDLAFHECIWKMPQQHTLDRLFRLVLPSLYAFFYERFSRSLAENPSLVEQALQRQLEVYRKFLEVLKTRDRVKIRKTFGRVLAVNWQTVQI
jgi:DNA-binding GntR family transcriptional regulator